MAADEGAAAPSRAAASRAPSAPRRLLARLLVASFFIPTAGRGMKWPRGFRLVCDGLLARDTTTALLQIGANDGGGAATSNDPVQGLLGHPNVRAWLIEPNPPVYALLQRNVRIRLGPALSRHVHTRNVAVCADTVAPRNTTFYVVSDSFVRDYPAAPHWARYQVSSMLRSNTERGVATALEVAMGNRSLPKAAAVAAAPSYVVPVTVLCDTPTSLLSAMDVKAEEVDIFAVDVEGLDVATVAGFLKLPGFRPTLVTFEAKLAAHDAPHELGALIQTLGQLGYEHNCKEGNKCATEDAFAWRRTLPKQHGRAPDGAPSGPCTLEDGCCTRHPRFCAQCTWANGCCRRHPRSQACISTRSAG